MPATSQLLVSFGCGRQTLKHLEDLLCLQRSRWFVKQFLIHICCCGQWTEVMCPALTKAVCSKVDEAIVCRTFQKRAKFGLKQLKENHHGCLKYFR